MFKNLLAILFHKDENIFDEQETAIIWIYLLLLISKQQKNKIMSAKNEKTSAVTALWHWQHWQVIMPWIR